MKLKTRGIFQKDDEREKFRKNNRMGKFDYEA